jgi:hypothetical protein
VAGDGFEQGVGLAGAAPAVGDFGFEVLSPGGAAGAGAWRCCLPRLRWLSRPILRAWRSSGRSCWARRLAATGGGSRSSAIADGVEVVVEEAGAGVRVAGAGGGRCSGRCARCRRF